MIETRILRSPHDTAALAAAIAPRLAAGDVIMLYGGLGSGKTFFVKQLGKLLGIDEEIDSPSFVLLKEYTTGRLPLYHLDLFRLTDESDIPALGILDMMDGGITCIEWAELAERWIPRPAYRIRFDYDGIQRSVRVEAP